MPPNKASRKAAALNILRLARTLHTKPHQAFVCSERFRTQVHDPEQAEPLDEVQWNGSRYVMNKSSKHFYLDDAILQAMVMLFVVARVQHGWKQTETCAQLSTWPTEANSKLPCQNPDLTNEWDQEIQKLIEAKKMTPKIRNSVNNYNSIVAIYSEDGYWFQECRKKCKFAAFHEVTEHSIVQWALAQREKDPHLSEVSVQLLKILFRTQNVTAQERIAVANGLFDTVMQIGLRDDPEDFSKSLLTAIQELDMEDAIKVFDPVVFCQTHLPDTPPEGKSKGIYRHSEVKVDFENLLFN